MTLSTVAQDANRSNQKRISVVIIDDYNLFRVGVRTFLGKFPHIDMIGESDNAEEGMALIQKLRPDVVLMDLGLPGMNGIEATHRIKAFDRNIKVVVLTSHEREEDVLAALGAGANAYCLKDIDSERLSQVIQTVNEDGAWLDPKIASTAIKLYNTPPSKPAPVKQDNYHLSDRELQVLELVVQGMTNTEIADKLGISVHTSKAHVCNILSKLYVNDRVQAAVKAIRESLV